MNLRIVIHHLSIAFVLILWASVSFAEPFQAVLVKPKQVYLNPFLEKHEYPNLTPRVAAKDWSWSRVDSDTAVSSVQLRVPVETGRAVEINSNYRAGTSVLVKGTGVNPEWVGDKNQIRFSRDSTKPLGFDGKFKTREALIDIYNSEFLRAMGVPVARPLGFVNLGYDAALKTDTCMYAREFVVQHRISNLFAMSNEEGLAAIDDSIDRIQKAGLTKKKLTRVQYFFWLTERMASSTGKMQAAGFQHGVFHYQQFTLAGELTDVGTGTWKSDPKFNPWFRKAPQPYHDFKFQPLLAQNMLVRSHSITADPPAPLLESSATMRDSKKSLLGFLKIADPETAELIESKNPYRFYWEMFEQAYQDFDPALTNRFKPSRYFASRKVGEENEYLPSHFLNHESRNLAAPELDTTFRNEGRLKPRNYYVDPWIKKEIQASYVNTFLDKTIPIPEKKDVPAAFWKANLSDDPALLAKIQKFRTELKAIKKAYGDLRGPEALRDLLRTMRNAMELTYGKHVNSPADKMKYRGFIAKRYESAGGADFGQIVNNCIGECHDSSAIGFLLGKVVEEQDPGFRVAFIKSKHGKNLELSHFQLAVNAPNKNSYVVDAMTMPIKQIGLFSDFNEPAYANRFNYMYDNFLGVVDPPGMPLQRATCPTLFRKLGIGR